MTAETRAGITTAELDRVAAETLAGFGARSAPQIEFGFPGVACISVNDEVVHGIPGPRVLRPGDMVKLDVTAELDGYVADAAVTVVLPGPDGAEQPLGAALQAAAESALRRGLAVVRAGRPIRVIGAAIEREVRRHGFAVFPELAGHGVGRSVHEPPAIPQFDDPEARQPLDEWTVITVEPIITAGADRVVQDEDGWTLRTVDGRPSAHAEHTVIVTRRGPLVVTAG